jgi:hypothetical protein
MILEKKLDFEIEFVECAKRILSYSDNTATDIKLSLLVSRRMFDPHQKLDSKSRT